MSASTDDPLVQLGARVPRSVRDAAKVAAAADGRTLNVWVARALGAALEVVPAVSPKVARDALPAPRRAPGSLSVRDVGALSPAELMAEQCIREEDERRARR